jgi:hypothetical protein
MKKRGPPAGRFCALTAMVLAGTSAASVIKVGPGEKYATPSAAIAAAKDGDTIQISSAGDYTNDVALIDKSNLIIEGTGPDRAKIKTDGRVYGKKGIWLFADGCTNLNVKNIDFEGARVAEKDGANGAGIRAQGKNLTVRNCRFYDNQDGILGGYGTTTIEHCEFDHNGLTGLTHNVYIADQAGTLVFRFNYSHDTVVGHLLKSRAANNIIEFNRLTDDHGTGSYELDLPNGGTANIIGNIIQQNAKSQNGTIFAYGEEGIINPKSELNVVNNTFINERGAGTFIHTPKLPANFRLVIVDNIFSGPGNLVSGQATRNEGNLVTSIAKAGFVNAGQMDFHLTADSPAIHLGVAAGADGTGKSLSPAEEYVDPLGERPRPVATKLDAGAFAQK